MLSLLNKGLKFIPTNRVSDAGGGLARDLARYERSIRLRHQMGQSQPLQQHGTMWNHAHDLQFRQRNPLYTPPPACPAVEQYLADMRQAVLDAWESHSTHLSWHGTCNLTAGERAALRQLRNEGSIVIKPADKNLGLTILDRAWYDAEMLRQLHDPKYYTVVSDAALPGVKDSLQRQLQRLVERWRLQGALPQPLADFLMGSTAFTEPAHVYSLPKIHKPVLAGRLICPSHSWITTRVSTWLAAELNEEVNKQPTVLADSRSLIRDVEKLRVPRDCLLVTFDVESLYPNIDHSAARADIASFFEGGGAKQHCIQDFLDFVMKNNYFRFRGNFYHQIHGTAMGTSVAPPYANLYLARLEGRVIAESPIKPLFYRRFIDDGFFIWTGSRAELDAFLHLLNSQHPSIRITHEVSDSTVHFLDLNISKDLSVPSELVPLVVSTYEKPMNKYLYIPFSSFHPPSVFKGFIKSRLISFVVTNSRFEDFCTFRAKFKSRLLARGYPAAFIEQICSTVSFSERTRYLHGQSVKRGSKNIPFFTDFTTFATRMHLKNIFRKVYAKHCDDAAILRLVPEVPMVVFYRGSNLQSKLVRAED